MESLIHNHAPCDCNFIIFAALKEISNIDKGKPILIVVSSEISLSIYQQL